MKHIFNVIVMSGLFLQASISAAVMPDAGIEYLTEAKIAECKQLLSRQIILKKYAAKSGQILAPIAIGAILYQLGFLDFIFGKSAMPLDKLPVDQMVSKAQVEEMIKRALPDRGNRFIEFGKAVWFQGITSVAGAIVVQSPIMAALSKPDFEWIFRTKTHVLQLADDGYFNASQYARYALTNPMRATYYKGELQNIISILTKDMCLLIAYLEYELEQISYEEAVDAHMDTMPRFLYNIFNDFLTHCEVAFDAGNATEIVNYVKELRADLVNSYDHCIIFSER